MYLGGGGTALKSGYRCSTNNLKKITLKSANKLIQMLISDRKKCVNTITFRLFSKNKNMTLKGVQEPHFLP